MKIIHISPSYKPAHIYGGTTLSVALLCEAIARTGTAIEVLTTTANGKHELFREPEKKQMIDGVPVRYFGRITKDHSHLSPKLLRQLNQTLSKSSNIVLHIHAWWNLTSVLSCLIAKYNGIPVILSPRGMLSNYSSANKNKLIKFILHHTLGKNLIRYSHLHATTEKERLDILKITSHSKITVIANLIPPALATSAIEPNENIFNLLFLSRIEKKKGLEILFRALSYLNCPWKLTIAGTGRPSYIKNLRKLSDQLKTSSSICWKGEVSGAAKYNLMAKSDLLVLFSHNENFANVVTESLSTGTPVAISDQVGLAPFIKQHDLGWISELEPFAIAGTLKQAFHDLEKRKRIRKTAPELIKKYFAEAKLVREYLQLYQQARK